jgi:hypothetical protein
MGIGLALCAVGMLLGVGTIGIGLSSGAWNFVTRGFVMIAVSAILILPVWSLQSVVEADAASDLSQMIDLVIERAQKALSLTKACSCASGFVAYACANPLKAGRCFRTSARCCSLWCFRITKNPYDT